MTFLDHAVAIAQGFFIMYLVARIQRHDKELEELRQQNHDLVQVDIVIRQELENHSAILDRNAKELTEFRNKFCKH